MALIDELRANQKPIIFVTEEEMYQKLLNEFYRQIVFYLRRKVEEANASYIEYVLPIIKVDINQKHNQLQKKESPYYSLYSDSEYDVEYVRSGPLFVTETKTSLFSSQIQISLTPLGSKLTQDLTRLACADGFSLSFFPAVARSHSSDGSIDQNNIVPFDTFIKNNSREYWLYYKCKIQL